MQSIRWVRISLLIVWGLISLAVRAQTLEASPPLEMGDKWTYRFHNIGDKREPYTFFHEVKGIENVSAWLYGESTQPNAQPPKFVWRVDMKRAEFVERFDHDAAAPNGAGKCTINRAANEDSLQFPLSVGKKYSVKQKWDNGNGYTEYKAEIQALEKVKVEGGEFDAYRIKYTGFWNNTNGRSYSGRAEWTRWYAPSVKATVKNEISDRTSDGRAWNQNTLELVRWEPGASARAAPAPAPSASK